jgi:putative acetyltransferase
VVPAPGILQAESAIHMEDARTLFREYAATLGFDLCFQDFDRELAELPGGYAPPLGRLFLAYADDRPAGCAALHAMEGGVCEMKRMYVRTEFRGLGLGRTLAVRCIGEARTIGYRAMRLDTIDTMREAIALYRSLGFVEIPSYRFNPVPGALFFERPL